MSELCYGFVRGISSNARVRVEFPDRDGVPSYWLAVLKPKTHLDKYSWLPDLGEHVACLLDTHGEDGVVLGAIYSARDPAVVNDPGVFRQDFADGGYIQYARSEGTLTIFAPVCIELKAPRILANDSAVCRIGDVDDDGDVMVTGAG